MIDRDLRRMHDDPLDVGGGERMPLADLGKRIERRMIAADAGIEFERNPHRLVALAQSGGQGREIEPVLRTRKRSAKTAIRGLKHVDNSGEPPLCKKRR